MKINKKIIKVNHKNNNNNQIWKLKSQPSKRILLKNRIASLWNRNLMQTLKKIKIKINKIMINFP